MICIPGEHQAAAVAVHGRRVEAAAGAAAVPRRLHALLPHPRGAELPLCSPPLRD